MERETEGEDGDVEEERRERERARRERREKREKERERKEKGKEKVDNKEKERRAEKPKKPSGLNSSKPATKHKAPPKETEPATETKPTASFDDMPIRPLANNKEMLALWKDIEKSKPKEEASKDKPKKEREAKAVKKTTEENKEEIKERKQSKKVEDAKDPADVVASPNSQERSSKALPSIAAISNPIDEQPIPTLAKSSAQPPSSTTSSPIPLTESPPPNLTLVPCSVCTRKFHPDRLEVHQKACKNATSPRKKFDSTRMRTDGVVAGSGKTEEMEKREAEIEEKLKKRKDGWRKKHGMHTTPEEHLKSVGMPEIRLFRSFFWQNNSSPPFGLPVPLHLLAPHPPFPAPRTTKDHQSLSHYRGPPQTRFQNRTMIGWRASTADASLPKIGWRSIRQFAGISRARREVGGEFGGDEMLE